VRRFNLRASSRIRPAVPKLWFLRSNTFLSRNLPKVTISYCAILSHRLQKANLRIILLQYSVFVKKVLGLFAICSSLRSLLDTDTNKFEKGGQLKVPSITVQFFVEGHRLFPPVLSLL
jgi:hypothetical protein